MNEKITLQDIVNLLCEKQGMTPKDAETFVRAMFDLIEEALTNEKYVKIKGLGTFKLTEVNSRESVHVNTGERIEIQGHSKVSFTPDTSMKELINKPFSHFETVVLNEGVELEDTVIEEEVTPEVAETTIITEEHPIIEQPVVEETQEETLVVEKPVIEEPEVKIVEEPIAETTTIETLESTEPEESEKQTIAVATEEEKPISIEEKEETPTSFVPQNEEKKSSRILLGIIIALVLIILLGFYWLFIHSSASTEVTPAAPVQEETVASIPVEEEKQPKDTLEIVPYVKLSTEELRNERVPSLADTLDYLIVGTKEEYTLQKGETIIRASVKFFGSKKYWPYIVKHNMDVLKDPDNIPAGAQVKIPVLSPKK